jgi:hypothetical protein
MRRKVTAVTLACFFALAGASYAAKPAPPSLPGANDQPGNSDCKGHQPPGSAGLCR